MNYIEFKVVKFNNSKWFKRNTNKYNLCNVFRRPKKILKWYSVQSTSKYINDCDIDFNEEINIHETYNCTIEAFGETM